MAFRIQVRRGTASEWTAANPTLQPGEFGFESDTGKIKIGTGAAVWSALAYLTGVSADTTPSLAGNLDVNGNTIVSSSNGNIPLLPNGTGHVFISGMEYPNTDGSAGQVLKTNGSNVIGFGNASDINGVSTYGASLIDDADAAAARTTLGLGSLATQSTVTNAYTGQIEAAADKVYTIDPSTVSARTITGFFIKCGSGTVTATLKNGSDTVKVASVSTSSGDQSSLANTSVAADALITITMSSNSSATDVIFSVEYTA
tara:strand:+ start:812 stop:1585 length:774 start_codon:yes stop_codon:yes gene_type:complete